MGTAILRYYILGIKLNWSNILHPERALTDICHATARLVTKLFYAAFAISSQYHWELTTATTVQLDIYNRIYENFSLKKTHFVSHI